MASNQKKYMSKIENKVYIRKVVDRIGISAKYKGYYFLIFIIGKLLETEYRSFSKELYPIVALEFGVKESSIERDIRNLISVSQNNLLHIGESKVTCRKFIFAVRDMVISRLKNVG